MAPSIMTAPLHQYDLPSGSPNYRRASLSLPSTSATTASTSARPTEPTMMEQLSHYVAQAMQQLPPPAASRVPRADVPAPPCTSFLHLSHGAACTALDEPPPSPLPDWCPTLHTETGVHRVLPDECCTICAHGGHDAQRCQFRALQRRCWSAMNTADGDIVLVRVAFRTRVQYLWGAGANAHGWHLLKTRLPGHPPVRLDLLPSEIISTADQCVLATTHADGSWK
jgi:hypothetical protein